MSEAELSSKMKLEIIKEKHNQIYNILTENSIDCWLIFARETETTPDSIMELVVGNAIVLQSAFIFTINKNKLKKIAIVGNFDANAEKEKQIWDEVIGYTLGINEILRKTIERLNPKMIALDYSKNDVSADGLSYGMYLILGEILQKFKDRFVSAETIIRALRGRKTKKELAYIKKACIITEQINQRITPLLKVGLSELEIQKMYYDLIEECNVGYAWQKHQNPMCDAGPDKEFGHVTPQPNIYTKQGHTLHNDFGIKYHDYCSDLQRMWFFGKNKEVPKELQHAIETIVQAIKLAADSIKPGLQGWKIDILIRDFIKKRGYEEFKHGLGHQVGLKAHDGGVFMGPLWERYGESPRLPLQEGQVFTIEPSIKTENFGMVALEEMIVITKHGCEFLVPPLKDFIYVR
jgi:Xaa-Pro aminopeptidase